MRSLPLPVPALAGGGVTLRPWRVDDVDHLVSAWKDPEVLRWTPVPDDAGPEKAAIWIAGARHRLETATALDLVVVDGGGTAVGEVGLSDLDHDRRVALIGWWTAAHKGRHGKRQAPHAPGSESGTASGRNSSAILDRRPFTKRLDRSVE